MEDLRDAEKSVSEFARLIDNLRPDENTRHAWERPDHLNGRHDSHSSHDSQKSTKASISARWRSKNLKKEWDDTVEGICR